MLTMEMLEDARMALRGIARLIIELHVFDIDHVNTA